MEKNNKIKDIREYKKENKNKNKRRRCTNKKLVFFFTAILMLGVCICNIYGYSVVSELKYDIHYLNKDLNKKEILLNQLEVENNNSTSIDEIENKVKEELNMDYPKDEQVEYIKIED